MVYGGKTECMYLQSQFYNLINVVAMAVYQAFPDRIDRRLSLGDWCGFSRNCPNHPDNSHYGGASLDANYYTLGETNHTHYVPKGEEKTRIWARCSTIDQNAFDWERNFVFWKALVSVVPGTKVWISDKIYDFIAERLKVKHGMADVYDFNKWTTLTTGSTYSHHIHAHITFGTTFDWAMSTRNILLK